MSLSLIFVIPALFGTLVLGEEILRIFFDIRSPIVEIVFIIIMVQTVSSNRASYRLYSSGNEQTEFSCYRNFSGSMYEYITEYHAYSAIWTSRCSSRNTPVLHSVSVC